jgi:hypothetical protein
MHKGPKFLLVSALTALALALTGAVFAGAATGKWVTGDFHTHTFLSDGKCVQSDVLKNAFLSGLDWIANCDHGGTSVNNEKGVKLDEPIWRWKSLRDNSFPLITGLRSQYPGKFIIQGFEWNVPAHEHASVATIIYEPAAISDFEYMFDAGDKDTSREKEGLLKQNVTHADALAGAKWLQEKYAKNSYFLPNHPSRKLLYSAADLRDFNDAAPDVCFGFEGIPGHQKEKNRGGYGNDYQADTYKARTYGGADYMIAKVGGLWDALLGEGRHFWTFANSDFHFTDNDFWPGEFSKNYTWVTGDGLQDIIDGMRSGKTFVVLGDLIDGLDFGLNYNKKSATMGRTLYMKKDAKMEVVIRFHSPKVNNNGDAVQVDHIDLISGVVGAKARPGTAAYGKDTNETARILARFAVKSLKPGRDGWYEVRYTVKKVNKNMYFRLRGTNLGLNVPDETDKDGNPLKDELMGENNAQKAYQDLWFYSNPIFVMVK